jgi:hypothetical protein
MNLARLFGLQNGRSLPQNPQDEIDSALANWSRKKNTSIEEISLRGSNGQPQKAYAQIDSRTGEVRKYLVQDAQGQVMQLKPENYQKFLEGTYNPANNPLRFLGQTAGVLAGGVNPYSYARQMGALGDARSQATRVTWQEGDRKLIHSPPAAAAASTEPPKAVPPKTPEPRKESAAAAPGEAATPAGDDIVVTKDPSYTPVLTIDLPPADVAASPATLATVATESVQPKPSFERKGTASVLNDWHAQGHEIYTVGDGAHSTYVAIHDGKVVSAASTIDKNKDQAIVMTGDQLTAKMQSLGLPTDLDSMMAPNAVKAIQDIALAESRLKPEGTTYLNMRSTGPSVTASPT